MNKFNIGDQVRVVNYGSLFVKYKKDVVVVDYSPEVLLGEASTDILERKEKFRQALPLADNPISGEIVTDFFNYWTEMNDEKTKMRFEIEMGFFDISYRLAAWKGAWEYETAKGKVYEETDDRIVTDIKPHLVGQVGIITQAVEQENTAYSLHGIPDKSSGYAEAQLELVYRPEYIVF